MLLKQKEAESWSIIEFGAPRVFPTEDVFYWFVSSLYFLTFFPIVQKLSFGIVIFHKPSGDCRPFKGVLKHIVYYHLILVVHEERDILSIFIQYFAE